MAASDGNRCIRNAAYRWYYRQYNVTNGNLNTGDAANHDVEVSLDGGAFADVAGTETEIGNGQYYVDLTAAENTGSTVCLVAKTSTASMFEPLDQLQHEPGLDSGVAQAGASTSITLRAAASATNDLYIGGVVEIVRGTGAGQLRTVIDYDGGTKVATVDRAWATNPDNTSVYLIHPVLAPSMTLSAAGLYAQGDCRTAGGDTTNYAAFGTGLAHLARSLQTGTVSSGATTSGFTSSLTGLGTNFLVNGVLTFTKGSLKGQSRKVATYSTDTGALTVYPEFTAAPSTGDEFMWVGLFV